jgi:CHAT domain-containing protein
MLIAPVESKIANGRRLRIEPDGFLNGVPWDALVDPRGHYLVERAAISILPGFYRSMRLKPIVPISAEDRALIVAVSSASGENLPPLADVVGEAQVVASKFASAQTLEDRDATLSAVREGMRGAMVFHFSGHAFSSPSRSGLVLSELDPNSRRSRLLNAASFSPREMSHLQLAVLSACNTVGLVQPGVSGSEGLTQALLNAGVPDVVASRWNVDSSATSEFMQQFYARLLAGKDAADSLRAAELNLASRRASSHPYFWAPFQLSGN